MSLERREFLRALLAAGLALAAGATGASAEELDQREKWRLELLREAWKRAAAEGRPLLAIVIPADEAQQQARGRLWGELFEGGSDEVMAALALVEVVTATEADLGRLLPGYEPAAPEPLLVRVDVATTPATWRTIDRKIPEYSDAIQHDSVGSGGDLPSSLGTRLRYEQAQFPQSPSSSSPSGSVDWERIEEEEYEKRVAALSAAVLDAIDPPRDALRAVPPEEAAEQRRAPIPGSRWGHNGGCAISFSGPDPLYVPPPNAVRVGYDCGMGHVPERSRIFLDFLVGPPRSW